MSTVANVKKSESGHWYALDGTPMYTVTAKGTGLPRATTLRDARALNLLPSVTTILKVLHREALVNWLCEQTALAILTSPRLPGEADDAFVERILHSERVQDQESQVARDRGTEIHDALETYFQAMINPVKTGAVPNAEIWQWIAPLLDAMRPYGQPIATEKILVGPGFAGKTDLVLEAPECFWLWDWKSTKKLPDPKKGGAWDEHRLQLSAYAKAFHITTCKGTDKDGPYRKPVRTANAYISTVEQGAFVICEHDDWRPTYENGFAPLVTHWQWSKQYWPTPTRPEFTRTEPQPAATQS